MKHDTPFKVFTALKIEAVDTLRKIKRLSANDFNVKPSDRDIKHCQDLIHLSKQYRHIATCIIYATCNKLTAAQADHEVKQHLHNNTQVHYTSHKNPRQSPQTICA